MRIKIFSLTTLLCFFSLYAQELSKKLPYDPTLKLTTMDNGLDVIIKKNNTPPGKVELYLHIGSGSLDEEDNQQGLAHFLEHLAFNGSKNFPPGSLIKYFESLGMTFGMHQNAFTSFNQTTYILTLPNTEEETIEKGLLCLSDFAFRLDLLDSEIDKERGVIEEENRARSSVQRRIFEQLLPDLLPGSRVAQRLPIGKMDIIKSATRERFVEFYEKWYHPQNATLIVVGDIEPGNMLRLIVKHFRAWEKAKEVPTHAESGVKPYTATNAVVIADPELTSASVSLISILPPRKVKTIGDYRKSLIANIGDWIMNRRMNKMVKEGKAAFQRASVSQSDFLNVSTYVSASAEGQSENWQKMLSQLTTELKRARTHGFHEQEMTDAIKTIFAQAERAVETEPTRESSHIIEEINDYITADNLPMAAQQEFDIINKLMPGITLDEVNDHFAQVYRQQHRLILVEIPDKAGLQKPDKEKLMEVVVAAEKAVVQPLVFKERPKVLIAKEPTPGRIISQSMHKPTQVTTVNFENGLVCHHKFMDFNKDKVSVTLNFTGGKIEETAANRGISNMATIPLRSPATSKLSSVDIQSIMTGKNVAVSGSAGEDKINITISGSQEDLEDGLRLAHILIRDAKIEATAFNLTQQQISQSLQQYKSSVDMQLRDHLDRSVTSNDPRFSMLTPQQLDALKLEEAQKWLDRILHKAPIEASIVGDIKFEQAAALINKYFGSLPKRSSFEHIDKLREIDIKREPVDKELKVDTEIPKSLVLVAWRGPDYNDKKDRHCMILAAKILSSRLHEEIREKKQLTYSAFAQAMINPGFKNKGLILTYFTTDKKKARDAADFCNDLVMEFKKTGPTAVETSTALKQIQNDIKSLIEQPSYWTAFLSDMKMYNKSLDDVSNIMKTYQSYTKTDIHDVLKKYIVRNGNIRIIALPK